MYNVVTERQLRESSVYAMVSLKYKPNVVKSDRETLRFILKQVCEYFNISPYLLKNKNRKRDFVSARHVTMYLISRNTNITLREIVNSLKPAVTHHSTVLHGIEKVSQQLNFEQGNDLKKAVKLISERTGLKI